MTVTAPAKSKELCWPRRRATRARGGARAANAAMPTGTLTKKIHSHDSTSTRMPPSSRPTAAPPAAIALHTPSAFVRSGPSANVVVMIDSAAGETSAAPRPCSARAAISIPDEVREPAQQRRDVENSTTPARKIRLRPMQVAGPAAEQQEAAEQQRVAVDDPLQVGRREAEVALDRGQRDVGDRRVEDDHELREADQDEDEPPVGRARGRRPLVASGRRSFGELLEVGVTPRGGVPAAPGEGPEERKQVARGSGTSGTASG